MSNAEAAILAQREAWRIAVESGDVDRVMSFYLPGDEYVAFDIMPPMAFHGYDAFRQNWVRFFDMFDGALSYELTDLKVTCSTAGDVAFVHGYTHFQGTTKGKKIDMWTRETNCLRHVDGVWLLAHDHISVPFDMESGRAETELHP